MLNNSYSARNIIPSSIILNNYSIQNLIITPKENIYCLIPNTYYYADSIGFVEIIGFPCDFDKITDYHPNKDNYLITEKELEIQRKLTDISRLKQYTIINLKNGKL